MAIQMQAKSAGDPALDTSNVRGLRRERSAVEIGLNAAILGVRDNEPLVLVVRPE